MKKFYISMLLILIGLVNYSQDSYPIAYFSKASFYNSEKGQYFETYLTVIGKSLIYKSNVNSKLQASINYLLVIKKDSNIIDFRKINLLSPELTDSQSVPSNFIDQQRFFLSNGKYKLEISFEDPNNPKIPAKTVQNIEIDFSSELPLFSSIQFIESYEPETVQTIYSKNGYYLKPYVSEFFPGTYESLTFYCELYKMDKLLKTGDDFLLKFYIESFENQSLLTNFNGFSREKALPVKAVLRTIDIKSLPSGNFNLVIEARDRNNKIIAQKKTFFQRSNPAKAFEGSDIAAINLDHTFLRDVSDKDTLKDYLLCLLPISDLLQNDVILQLSKSDDQTLQKQYFYNFWLEKNPQSPEYEWKKYQNEVKKVNREFGYFSFRGHQTPRGRTWLKYGAPDIRTESKYESGYYPYEVWQYYRIESQMDVKFVFYNEHVDGFNYELLYTNRKGEIYTSDWEKRLQKSDMMNNEQEGNRLRRNILDPK